ncbi:AhpC-TSA-domain-containing protein [Meredithblackwellia eburnea MCA 4105]
MATKRKEPAEATRKSSRASTVESSSKPPSTASKPASKAKKPASKKADAAPVAEAKEEEATGEPEAKKAKLDEEPAEEKAVETAPAEEEETKKSSSTLLAVGDLVPDVTLKNEDGEDVSLGALYKDNGLVIFSYPKASTPGCTTQACNFRDTYDEISATGFKIFGISQDSPKAQLGFKTKHTFQYSLLSDPSKALLKPLGHTDKNKRNHWIIGKGGKLLEIKIGVKPADDAKNAFAFIKGL